MQEYDHDPEQAKQHQDPFPEIAGARIISYNFSEGERPGGMKVRAKIRIAKGRQAEALNTVQAEVIRELLEWVRQHRQQQ